MKLTLEGIGKKYNRDWIFKNVHTTFSTGTSYAILGPNGSGKSTLLKIISGHLIPSEGKIKYLIEKEIEQNDIYKYISYSAPYIELIEEYTVREQILFHKDFKPLINNASVDDILNIMNFQEHKNKELRNLSSGMRQRLKLVLSILSDVPVLLLDEPATNLDKQGVEWYRDLMSNNTNDRLVIVASNRADEYDFCQEQIDMLDFK